MAAEYCHITFDNPYNTYFAGQTISGKVEIRLRESKQIKGVRIEIKGTANVRWTESETEHVRDHHNSFGRSRDNGFHNDHTRTRMVTYYADEEYFYSRNHLVRGGDQDTFTLPAGNHLYMFSCPLPPTLPSSLEGEHGHIRYEAEVIIERPWIWNQKTKAVFTVISNYNLNMFPQLLSPGTTTSEKYFCCFCCKSGPLTAVIRTPKSGYVGGEQMPVVIEVDNTSTVDVDKIGLKFQQLITFKSTFPTSKTKDQKIVFVETNLGSVEQRASKTVSYTLSIPPLPPSSLNECAIMAIKYQLILQCVVSGCHTNLEATIPITIGTVPFSQPGNSAPPAYSEVVGVHNQASAWAGNVVPSAPAPTFSESEFFKPRVIQCAGDDGHTSYNNGSGEYAPTYPIYKYNYPIQQ